MGNFISGLCVVLLFIGLVILASAIASIPVYLVWNYVVCFFFEGVKVITLFQAWIISMVLSFLINLLK